MKLSPNHEIDLVELSISWVDISVYLLFVHTEIDEVKRKKKKPYFKMNIKLIWNIVQLNRCQSIVKYVGI